MIMASLTYKLAEGFVKPSSLFFFGKGGGGARILAIDQLPNTFAQPSLDNEQIFQH